MVTELGCIMNAISRTRTAKKLQPGLNRAEVRVKDRTRLDWVFFLLASLKTSQKGVVAL